jgi:hypothetical protein
MAEKAVEVSEDGLARLQSAVADFARAEITRIVEAVINDLRSYPAYRTFGDDVEARHFWDEYCWGLQKGPFGDNFDLGNATDMSLAGTFDELVRAAIQSEVEKLPRHAKVFLSALASEEDNPENVESLGSIWVDGIVNLILADVNRRASRRDLDLIGPDRVDVIGYEIEGSGIVWSVLSDRDEKLDLIARHADALIDPNGDLSGLAHDMVEAFIAAVREEAPEGGFFLDFLDRFESDVRSLLREHDVLPLLRDIRADLLDRLDA